MRKILIVNQTSGYLTVEIANAFLRSGKYEEVAIAAGNKINQGFKLDEKVKVQKIKNYNTKNTITRFTSWVTATIQVIFLCWFKYKTYELFLISNPPTTAFSHNFCKNKYSTLIFDVYPDGLGNFASKKSLIYRVWAKNNKLFYKKATYIYTLTNSMAKYVAQYCPIDRIEVVSLWANPNLEVINAPKSENKFLQSHPELQNKFLIMYSGNIGIDHEMGCILKAIKEIGDLPICLVFIGEGYNKPVLQKLAKDLQIQHMCKFYPYQDWSILPYSLKSADLSIVATKPNGRSSSIPSKVFDLIKLNQPILCIAHPDSEISLLVKKHAIGKTFMPDQVSEIAAFIKGVYNKPDILDKFIDNTKACAPLYTSELAKRYVK